MSESHYFKVGHLIDGSGGQIQQDMLLTVKDGLFQDIGCFAENMVLEPTLVTDLSNCTIMPPLIDSHVHLCMSGSTDQHTREVQLTADYDTTHPRIIEHLRHHFSHGVLAVRDGGDHLGHTLGLKKTSAEAQEIPVIIKASGRAWHQKGRYGAFLGRSPENGTSLADAFAQECDPVDHVKLINSGLNSLKQFGRQTSPQFTLAELKIFSSLVNREQKKLMVHANGKVPVQDALEAGCHSIEHGFFMGKENIKRMAETETTWVPTVFPMKAYGETLGPQNTETVRGVVRRTLEEQLAQITLAKECGVSIALGTDAGSRGVFHGEAMVEEMELFMKAGFSLTEAIQCATFNGAQLLGIDEIGLIAKGRPASFLVFQATPAMLPGKLSDLETIYINGRPCNKELFSQ